MTMAASAPPPTALAGWTDARSSENGRRDDGTKALEVGMSGMNLISTLPSSSRPPGLSVSSLSSTAEHSRHHSFGSLSLPSADQPLGNYRGTPPSPVSPLQRLHPNVPKPPGYGGPTPPQRGLSTGSHNSSTMSPGLTVTPPSSVDGAAELLSNLGRQASPFGIDPRALRPSDLQEQLASPWADHDEGERRGKSPPGLSGTNAGISDRNVDDPDDGLRGLGALRERSQSSPGPLATTASSPYSTSPPVRIDVSNHQRDLSPLHYTEGVEYLRHKGGLPPDPRKMRQVRDSSRQRSRPPLSGGGNNSQLSFPDTASSFSAVYKERQGGSIISQGSLQNSSPDHSFVNDQHTSLYHGEGTSTSSDANRMRLTLNRSASIGTGISSDTNPDERNFSGEGYRHSHTLEHSSQHPSAMHKFGQLPTLSGHVHQQRATLGGNISDAPPPGRYGRSLSLSAAQQQQVHQQFFEGHDELRIGVRSDGRVAHTHLFDSDGGYTGGRNIISSGDTFLRGGASAMRSRSISAVDSYTHHTAAMLQRNARLPQSNYTGRVEGSAPHMQRRSSDITYSSFRGLDSAAYHMHPSMSRKEEHGGSRFEEGLPVMATPEEMRMFGIPVDESPRNASLARAPYASHTGQVSRRHSDFGIMPLSQPVQGMPQRSGSFSGLQGLQISHEISRRASSSSIDDDLAHPLVGEYIDHPGDDVALNVGGHSALSVNSVYQSVSGYPRGEATHGGSMHIGRAAVEHQGIPAHYSLEPVHQLSAGASYQPPRWVYTVKFKRTQRSFILGSVVTRDLKIGCYVKVEADRGEDLGVVVAKIPADKFNSSGRGSFRAMGHHGMGNEMGLMAPTAGMSSAGIADLKRIIRLATHDEVSLLAVKREEEDELLKVCRGKVRQRGLPMHVVDAEYQFDRHKLTFFFEAEGRIDFRELVRDLFSMYKTRIWMQQLDKNVGGAPSIPSVGPGDFGGSRYSALPQRGDLSDVFHGSELGYSE